MFFFFRQRRPPSSSRPYTLLPYSTSFRYYFNAALYAYTYQTLQDKTADYLVPQYDRLPELFVRGARYNWGGFEVQSDNYATRFVRPVYTGSSFPQDRKSTRLNSSH